MKNAIARALVTAGRWLARAAADAAVDKLRGADRAGQPTDFKKS